MSEQATRLFTIGYQSLLTLRKELATCGVPIDPRLELRRWNGLLCYYDRQDGHIYLSTLDPATAHGKFKLLLLRSLIRFDSTDEVLRLLELLIPWLVAHEVGHHLRHRYGRLGARLEVEEQIASQLASAFVKRYLTATEKNELLRALAKGRVNLAHGLPATQVISSMQRAHSLVHHVYIHMNWFYEDLLLPEGQPLAEFVQLYLKP